MISLGRRVSGNVVEGAVVEYGRTAVVVILMICLELLIEQSFLGVS